MLAKRLIKSNDAGGGACTNTVDLYNPFPDGGGVALYQLNGDATDVSGNYDGTATNVTYGAGQFGQGASFNTSNSVLTTPRAFSTNSPYSVSGWAKIANGSTTQAVYLAWQITGTNQSQVTVSYDGVSTYTLLVNHKFQTNSSVGYNFAANDGQWHHYAVTFNGSSANLYIDGSFVKSGLLDPKGDVSSTNYIGGTNVYNGITYYNGLDGIDQVRYFNRALRPYEIEALYTEEYCTPTIVPSEHFNTVLYTGDSSTNRQITGVGFQPDLVWIKTRTSLVGNTNHFLFDSIRGVHNYLRTDLDFAESSATNTLTSFDINGFTLGDNISTNYNANDIVAWNFKAGGAAVTNTDGVTSGIYTGVTSQVSANTDSGFSIQTFTSSGSGKVSWGHGLGVVPKLIILKSRSATGSWDFISPDLIEASYGLRLNTNAAATNYTNDYAFFDSSKIDIGSSNYNIGQNTFYVSYAFAEVEGFSSFGSYVGNGSTSGNVITTGFEPAFLLIKRTNGTNDWILYDNKRNTTNPRDTKLSPNTSNAEYTAAGINIDFLENGFQIKGNDSAINASSGTGEYIYMAFAADPTTIEPTLEDSFNTVTYTGNGGSQSITGVGFEPQLSWIKVRNAADQHFLVDDVRGNFYLRTNDTTAETAVSGFNGFTSDGFDFSLGGALYNGSGLNYVSWNWKGAELPAINSNGSIPSVVSANPAAGFSIVSYTTPSTNNFTVGHGLSDTPKIMIIKGRSIVSSWTVYSSEIGASNYLQLNNTNASTASTLPFNNTAPTSNVFTLGSSTVWYGTNEQYIAYCFAEVAGFSKFGSYTGNGGTNTPIDCGFEPAFILVKKTDSSGGNASWGIFDNKRSTSNPRNKALFPNLSNAEATEGTYFNFSSTGFTVVGSGLLANYSGSNYIYMAFANQF